MYAGQRDKLKETLLKAQQASVRAKDLTRQLHTFSRGSLPLKKFASLGEIITENAALALRDSDAICSYNIPADLWEVKVDEEQIGQVINTLVTNSTEAMPEGGNITIAAENKEVSADELPPLPEGRYVKISVADNGRGIPRELLQKIFDPYFTTKQDGRGLGLTISYAIIRNHDGHISVESEPNKGAVFHIYLPTGR